MKKCEVTMLILLISSALFLLFSGLYYHEQKTEYEKTYKECEKQLGESYNMLSDIYTECELYLEDIDVIHRYSVEYNVDPKIILAVMKLESDFKEDAINGDNYGLMQINGVHLKDFENKMEILGFSKNIECGVSLLSGLQKQSSDLHYILNSYNMGQYGYKSYVAKTGKVTRAYSRHAIEIINKLKGKESDGK